MKNIHILPTDKPSRLYLGNNGNFVFGMMQTSIRNRNDDFTNQNIYITSDEEIKDGTWVIQKSTGKFMFLAFTRSDSYNKNKDLKEEFSKIILTTDQDLIKDGVQAIDDEFLEWFVKNPSCEEVEVEIDSYIDKNISESVIFTDYKIIISKEEPKQETLEDAAIIYAHKSFIWPLNKQGEKQSIPPGQIVPPGYAKHQKIASKHFTNGVKWEQEQEKKLFSNEEVLKLLILSSKNFYAQPFKVEEWFEQFKKK